jgi:hypothetical protein
MSSDAHSFDPYRSPSLPEGPYSGPPPTGRRPGLLTTLCVLCIVLGALGLFNSLFGGFMLVVGHRFQQFVMKSQSQTPGVPPEMQKAQEEMQTEIYAIQEKYLWALASGLVFRFLASGLLLVGGSGALGLKPWGRQVLIAGCAVAAPFVMLDAILQSLISMENMTVMNSYMERMIQATPGNGAPQNVEGFIRGMFGFIKIASIAVVGLIALAKIALYIFGLIYLNKPHIKALFVPTIPSLTSVS